MVPYQMTKGKNMQIKSRASCGYRFSGKFDSQDDMQSLANLRESIAKINSQSWDKTNRLPVVVRGRKPIVKHRSVEYWTKKVSNSGYDAAGNVVGGIKNAKEFDVYVYTRRV